MPYERVTNRLVTTAVAVLIARLLWSAPAPPAGVDGFIHGMGLTLLVAAVVSMIAEGR